MFVLKGEVAMRQEDRVAILSAGDMMIYHQGRPFNLACKERCDLIMINIPKPVDADNSNRSALGCAYFLKGYKALTGTRTTCEGDPASGI